MKIEECIKGKRMDRYEEALERAKAFIKRGGEYDRQVMESIFPELKESEDERIRKALLCCCDDWEKGQFGCMKSEDVPAIRAYLEKKKEQKHLLNFDAISSWLRDHASRYVNSEYNEFHHCTEYDGTINVERLIADLKVAVDSGAFDVHKQKEQKPAKWSEEDEEMRKRAICACNFTIKRLLGSTHYEEACDWLKSLPIGFITNPNYNSDMVDLLVCELQTIAKDNGVPKQYDAEISWLKSLRPKPHWKPSKEQMEALEHCVNGWQDTADGTLESLYNDLQKLL